MQQSSSISFYEIRQKRKTINSSIQCINLSPLNELLLKSHYLKFKKDMFRMLQWATRKNQYFLRLFFDVNVILRKNVEKINYESIYSHQT